MLFAIYCYICDRKPKRKRALLGSNPPAIGFRATLSEHAELTGVSFVFLAQIAPMAKKTLCRRGPCLPGVAPASFLRSRLTVDHIGRFHADASVRPTGVVELYDSAQFGAARVYVRYPHLVEPLGFQYPVGALCDGVLKWISTLGHAYHDVMLLELLDVGITAVLTPPVGVVDQPG